MLAAIPAVLDGEPLTREALAARGGGARGGGGAGREARRRLRRPAQARGVHRRPVLRAVRRAARALHAARRRWLDGFTPPGPDEAAAADVVRTYLAAYGPAPREQFQRWFGMTSPAEAGRWIRALGDEVAEVDVEGAPGWMLAADVEEAAAAVPAGVVRLLPGFDQYVVGAPRDAEAVLAAAHRARVYRPQGWLSPGGARRRADRRRLEARARRARRDRHGRTVRTAHGCAAGGRGGRGGAARRRSSAGRSRSAGTERASYERPLRSTRDGEQVDVGVDEPRPGRAPPHRAAAPGSDAPASRSIEAIVAAAILASSRSACSPGIDGAASSSGREKARSVGERRSPSRIRSACTAMRAVDLPELRADADGERRRHRVHGQVGGRLDLRHERRHGLLHVRWRQGRLPAAAHHRDVHDGRHSARLRVRAANRLVAPPVGSAGGNNGTLAVQVKNRDALGEPNVTVSIDGDDREPQRHQGDQRRSAARCSR